MNLKKVSICIATYNGEEFIKRQIDSILPQLNEDDEIIISDDSSTDNTIEIIRSINDYRIKIFTDQKFKNPALNFENAIKMATGDYIFLCDQDDIWIPNKISVMTAFLKDYDFVVSDCIVIDQNKKVVHESFFKFRNSGKGFFKNLSKNTFLGCCIAFRQSLKSKAIPFPKGIIYEHDWWIGLIASIYGKVCFIDQPLMYYVRHGNNASLTSSGQGYPLRKQLRNRIYLAYNVLLRMMKSSQKF